MKNLHLIPTDKPSRLHLWTDENNSKLALCDLEFSHTRNTQNIYITSDEEIKEGDWVYNIVSKNIFKASKQLIDLINDPNVTLTTNKKIIITTDQDLINDGVQAIDDDFLEWFVQNPSCEEIEVRKVEQIPNGITFGMFGNDEPPTELIYKIIIPKEEPKQETLEEREPYWDLVDAKAEQNNTIDLDDYAKGVQDGVKWQKERSYSEEEIFEIFDKWFCYRIDEDVEIKLPFSQWFKQFKKK
jgi:hypothetical protein